MDLVCTASALCDTTSGHMRRHRNAAAAVALTFLFRMNPETCVMFTLVHGVCSVTCFSSHSLVVLLESFGQNYPEVRNQLLNSWLIFMQ